VVAEPMPTRQADSFAALGAGLEFTRALNRSLSIMAGADFRQRAHAELDRFDSRSADLYLGALALLDDGDSLRLTLGHNQYDLDHARYRRMQSAAVEWTRQLGERARASLYGQGYRIRYLQEAVQANSSDVQIFGASGAYVLHAPSGTVAFGSLYAGSDDATSGRADGDRRLQGLSLTLQRRLLAGIEGYATFAVIDSDYRRDNPASGARRHDRQHDQAVGLSWRISAGWYLRPHIARTHNGSNLEIEDFRRTEVSLSLRRVWQ
jgi:hypothetical protein